MHVHLTCSSPTRSLVVTLHGMREVLAQAGHRVTISWPETWSDELGERRCGLDRRAIAGAHVVVHAASRDEGTMPEELTEAAASGRAVLRFATGAAGGDDPETLGRLEDLVDAVSRAAAATLG